MKEYYLTRDNSPSNISNNLHVCGTDAAAVDLEHSKGREVIGKIKTELDILEVKRFISGKEGEKYDLETKEENP